MKSYLTPNKLLREVYVSPDVYRAREVDTENNF